MTPAYRIGVNHHLLHLAAMEDAGVHESTLAEVLELPGFDAVDMYCTGDPAQRAREARSAASSGRSIVYNPPLLFNIPGCDQNAVAPETVRRTRDTILPHLDSAAACGAKLTNITSGPNPLPDDRAEAWSGWVDFLAWYGHEAATRGMRVVIEPFDQSIGKNLLVGPTADALKSVDEARGLGADNVGLMVDMGHLPIMGESFEHAVGLSSGCLWHVPLGSAVIRDPSHQWYGDCHPPLAIAAGEHGVDDLAAFLSELAAVGYVEADDATLTCEMRPYENNTPAESAAIWRDMIDEAWGMLTDIEGEQ